MLESAARVYLQRLSVIWSDPLSDHHKVVATNQFPTACTRLLNVDAGMVYHRVAETGQRVKEDHGGERWETPTGN